MYQGQTIALILPARNEALALPEVLKSIPSEIDYVILVDNGSTDDTVNVAKENGVLVVSEPRTGYGQACLSGIDSIREIAPDIIAFADADGSDDIARLHELLDPLVKDNVVMAIEQRIPVNANVFSIQQRFGNWLATSLIFLIWGYRFKDLGPMRVIRWNSLQLLCMRDKNYGWTVEMQIKALNARLRIIEIPLPYRERAAGKSKVSKTFSGSIRAGIKILWVIFRETITSIWDQRYIYYGKYQNKEKIIPRSKST